MATKKETETAAAEAQTDAVTEPDVVSPEDFVTIKLFKDNDKYKDDVFVAVNGERCQIQRGIQVRIKRKFADVLEQSMEQDEATANLITRCESEYQADAAAHGV